MKGMRKISRGSGFAGALNYVFDREGKAQKGRYIGGNMAGMSPVELIKEFGANRRLRPTIKKPVWHNSLRLPVGEKLDDKQWNDFANDYMHDLGFSDFHPRVYVMHNDPMGQHIHILASRIDAFGELYYGENENLKSTQIISKLEKRHNLIITKGADLDPALGKIVMPEKKKIRKNEKEKERRTGIESPKNVLQTYIDQAIKLRPSALELALMLEKNGVKVRANVASTGRMNGFSFEFQGSTFSGSKLGDKYKWSSLLKQGVTFDPIKDGRGLERFRSKAIQVEIESDGESDQIKGTYAFILLKFMNQTITQNGIEYRWQNGSPALLDTGSSVKVMGKSTDAKIKAMLDLAERKGWKTVDFFGKAEFKKRAAIEAVRRGLTVRDPALHRFAMQSNGLLKDVVAPKNEEFAPGNVRRTIDWAINQSDDEDDEENRSGPRI
jgi:hypothetical protein